MAGSAEWDRFTSPEYGLATETTRDLGIFAGETATRYGGEGRRIRNVERTQPPQILA